MEDNDKDGLSEYAEWKKRDPSDSDDPKELFKQVTHISLCISYDLIDKIRWWEKETLKLSDEEVEKRLPHITASLDSLKAAYLEFSEVDF